MNFIRRGRLGGIVGSLLGLFLIVSSRSIPASRVAGDPGSGMLPLMAGVICLISGLVLMIKKPDQTDEKTFLTKKEWKKVILILSMYLAFFVGMFVLGYIITAPIVIFATCSIIARGKNVSLIKRILYSIGVAAFIYILFHMVLKVVLPVGLLRLG